MLNAYPHTWYVLSYYLRYPVLGWFIRRMCIALNRDNPLQVAQEFVRGIKLIEGHNRHIIIFPEGKRFIDGQVHKFLSGFAVIARTTNRPVVPLFFQNVGKVYPPNSFWIHRYPISIDIGEHFIYQEGETDSQFTERVYQWFVSKS
jgi:1-acyl-sn-glycerol-3-phosphate acyltransferase